MKLPEGPEKLTEEVVAKAISGAKNPSIPWHPKVEGKICLCMDSGEGFIGSRYRFYFL